MGLIMQSFKTDYILFWLFSWTTLLCHITCTVYVPVCHPKLIPAFLKLIPQVFIGLQFCGKWELSKFCPLQKELLNLMVINQQKSINFQANFLMICLLIITLMAALKVKTWLIFVLCLTIYLISTCSLWANQINLFRIQKLTPAYMTLMESTVYIIE